VSPGEPTPNDEPEPRAGTEDGDAEELRRALSGLHRMPAPTKFEADVEDTIRRRSGGRFFGRKAFGDRVPFAVIGMVVIALGLVVFFLLRCSDTGSLRYERDSEQPRVHPEAKDQMPTPRRE
jgi:hypothetical protein